MKIEKAILIFLLLFITTISYSQVITISFQKQSLTEALNEIGKNYNIKFAFDNELTDEIIVTGKYKNEKAEVVVASLLSNTKLDYKKQGEVFILFPAPDKPEEKIVRKEIIKPVCLIKGIVKDKLSGENLPYATVYIPGTSAGAMTNSDGFFNIITGSCDSTTLTVSYLGYNPANYKTKPATNPVNLLVLLNSQAEMLEEIEIKYEVKILENSIKEDPYCTRLNLSRSTNIPSISELDIVTPIQSMSGIDATTESSAGLEIRKSAPDKNLIIYDGFNVYQIDHFFGSFSSINSKLVKDIKVYKTIPDAKYGGRTSGVVEITGKSGNMNKPVFDFGADMLSFDGKIELPVVKDKLSIIAAGRRSYTDLLQTPVYVSLFKDIRYDFEDYNSNIPFSLTNQETDPNIKFYDFGSKLTWKPAEKQIISLSYHEARDAMNFAFENEFPTLTEKSNTYGKGAGLRWAGQVAKRWESEITLGYSLTHMFFDHEDSKITRYQRQRITITDTVDRNYELNSNLEDFTGGFNNKIYLNSKNQIETGLQINYFNSDYYENISLIFNRRSFGDTTRNYLNSSLLSSPYIQHIFNNRKWIVKSGVRLGYFSLIKNIKPEFRLSASYSPNEKIMIKAMAGNYFQYTNKIDLIDQGDFRSTWILSDDKTFPVVKSFHFSGGINYNISKTLNLDIELYQKQNDGMVTMQYVYSGGQNSDIRQEFRIYNYNAVIRGADILLRKSFGKYQAWVAYTLSRSISQSENVNNGDPFPSDNDQLHEIKLFNSIDLKNWNFSLSWIFGSGKPWDYLTYTTNYGLTTDYEKNSERLPAYHRMDGGINYTYKTENKSLKIGLNIFNMYNKENILDKFITLKSNSLGQGTGGNTSFEITEITGLGFTPNLFINFRF